MTARVTIGWPALVAGALTLLTIGAGVTLYITRRPPPALAPAPQAKAAAPAATAADVVVSLAPEAAQRAGVTLATVAAGRTAAALRLPGVVEPNAYKTVVVTPLVGGRVTRVLAELGQAVRRGQPIAEIFSPELAEAETRFVAVRAELDAHERELARTEKLVEIGSASRQELERLHAEHAAKQTDVESVRSRLELLGLSPSTIASLGPGKSVRSTVAVPAPIDGVVTERVANAGLNVDTTAKLFTVVDLSTVWIVADVYEKDFSRVRVGSAATVTTTAFPDMTLAGRVSYLDPQVSAETRTAKVRVEVPNPARDLRLGMFADVSIEATGAVEAAIVPRSAVQNVGSRTVVYLADPSRPGTFVEREVRLGDRVGTDVAVLDGLKPGEAIVSDGSFSVRAERDRLGLPASRAAGAVQPQDARIRITEQGYEPARITLRAGVPARITFVRATDQTCGTEIVFPSLNIRRPLPLNQPVVIEFTPKAGGEIAFACGMNMLRGTVVVAAQ